jgi:hypothetical protein
MTIWYINNRQDKRPKPFGQMVWISGIVSVIALFVPFLDGIKWHPMRLIVPAITFLPFFSIWLFDRISKGRTPSPKAVLESCPCGSSKIVYTDVEGKVVVPKDMRLFAKDKESSSEERLISL